MGQVNNSLDRGVALLNDNKDDSSNTDQLKAQNAAAVSAVITQRLLELRVDSTISDPREVLARELPDLLASANFDPGAYHPRSTAPQGYGKELLFRFDEDESPFCLQVFAFDPGQETPIHDHPCECASLVLLGEIVERSYDFGEDSTGDITQAVLVSEHRRGAGSHEQLLPCERNIHSLLNDSPERAITVHLYNMDGVRQTAAIKEVFRRAP